MKRLPRRIEIGLWATRGFVVVNAVISDCNTSKLVDGERRVSHTREVLAAEVILSTLKDAETGQHWTKLRLLS